MINFTSNGENWKAYQVALSKPSKLALEQEEYLLLITLAEQDFFCLDSRSGQQRLCWRQFVRIYIASKTLFLIFRHHAWKSDYTDVWTRQGHWKVVDGSKTQKQSWKWLTLRTFTCYGMPMWWTFFFFKKQEEIIKFQLNSLQLGIPWQSSELGLSTLTVVATVQSLVGELRYCKPCSTAEKKGRTPWFVNTE